MSLDCLTMIIEYNIKTDKFEIRGDVNEKGRSEILENFLRMQIGAGQDNSQPNRMDVYTITLKWYPSDDRIESYSDTGNLSLRDGILMRILKDLQ